MAADMLGSYVIPFQVAGGITIVGSFIPFMLLCYTNARIATRPPRGQETKRLKSLRKWLDLK